MITMKQSITGSMTLAFGLIVATLLVQQYAIAIPPTIPTSPCDVVRCASPRSCEVDKVSGRAKCVCPSVCSLIYQPVCGSDGETYSNECTLKVESCKQDKQVSKQYDGKCVQSTGC